MIRQTVSRILLAVLVVGALVQNAHAQFAVHGKIVYPVVGRAIRDGVVIIEDGKIKFIGKFWDTVIPTTLRVLEAEVVIPGLIDAHTTVGLSGLYNQKQDQDQLERSASIQPELRALDAYNPDDKLIKWVRSFGVTTIHTGHAPGELISGQTMIVKTYGNTVEEALLRAPAALAATLGQSAKKKEKGKSPGTRGKMMAMLRGEFIKAQEYQRKRQSATDDKRPSRDLKLEAIGLVLSHKIPLMVTAHRVQDIASALRLKEEFNIRLWLDGGTEALSLAKELKAAGVPVFVHPPMTRAWGERENASFETPAKLVEAGVIVAMQSGYESYVPKTRVVLLEAALAVANGMDFHDALDAITIDPARILGIADRVGSIEVGKDGDLALYDGDPFEYTTHCTGVLINGQLMGDERR